MSADLGLLVIYVPCAQTFLNCACLCGQYCLLPRCLMHLLLAVELECHCIL